MDSNVYGRYTNKTAVAGVVYINDINRTIIQEATRLSPAMVIKLCRGTLVSFDQVVLATSQWDSLPAGRKSKALDHEEKLVKSASCQRLRGAKIMRIQEKPADHQKIIAYLLMKYLEHLHQTPLPLKTPMNSEVPNAASAKRKGKRQADIGIL